MDEVAKAFISHYYQAFQKDRASLGPLYVSFVFWFGFFKKKIQIQLFK